MNKTSKFLVATFCAFALNACTPGSETTSTTPAAGDTDAIAEQNSQPMQQAVENHVANTLIELSATQLQQASQMIDSCNIEKLNGLDYSDGITQTQGALITVEGWAFDKNTAATPAMLYLRIANVATGTQWQQPIDERSVREDVATSFPGNASVNAGFRAILDTSTLQAGEYKIFLATQSNPSTSLCDNGRKINLLAR